MIIPPKNCPSCNSLLEWVEDQLYCNSSSCPAKASKQIEHFAKTLKIKGLGPSTINQLNLESIFDIYTLDINYTEMIVGLKTATKLLEEIKISESAKLNKVLPALGIPLIGQSATDKLASVCESIFDIDATVCKKAGLGPKATDNLITWLDNNLEIYVEELPFCFNFEKIKERTKGVVCITGKLLSFPTKASAKQKLEELGYTVKDSITKDVTILVNESGKQTSKTLQAENNGVKVINNLNILIGE